MHYLWFKQRTIIIIEVASLSHYVIVTSNIVKVVHSLNLIQIEIKKLNEYIFIFLILFTRKNRQNGQLISRL